MATALKEEAEVQDNASIMTEDSLDTKLMNTNIYKNTYNESPGRKPFPMRASSLMKASTRSKPKHKKMNSEDDPFYRQNLALPFMGVPFAGEIMHDSSEDEAEEKKEEVTEEGIHHDADHLEEKHVPTASTGEETRDKQALSSVLENSITPEDVDVAEEPPGAAGDVVHEPTANPETMEQPVQSQTPIRDLDAVPDYHARGPDELPHGLEETLANIILPIKPATASISPAKFETASHKGIIAIQDVDREGSVKSWHGSQISGLYSEDDSAPKTPDVLDKEPEAPAASLTSTTKAPLPKLEDGQEPQSGNSDPVSKPSAPILEEKLETPAKDLVPTAAISALISETTNTISSHNLPKETEAVKLLTEHNAPTSDVANSEEVIAVLPRVEVANPDMSKPDVAVPPPAPQKDRPKALEPSANMTEKTDFALRTSLDKSPSIFKNESTMSPSEIQEHLSPKLLPQKVLQHNSSHGNAGFDVDFGPEPSLDIVPPELLRSPTKVVGAESEDDSTESSGSSNDSAGVISKNLSAGDSATTKSIGENAVHDEISSKDAALLPLSHIGKPSPVEDMTPIQGSQTSILNERAVKRKPAPPIKRPSIPSPKKDGTIDEVADPPSAIGEHKPERPPPPLTSSKSPEPSKSPPPVPTQTPILPPRPPPLTPAPISLLPPKPSSSPSQDPSQAPILPPRSPPPDPHESPHIEPNSTPPPLPPRDDEATPSPMPPLTEEQAVLKDDLPRASEDVELHSIDGCNKGKHKRNSTVDSTKSEDTIYSPTAPLPDIGRPSTSIGTASIATIAEEGDSEFPARGKQSQSKMTKRLRSVLGKSMLNIKSAYITADKTKGNKRGSIMGSISRSSLLPPPLVPAIDLTQTARDLVAAAAIGDLIKVKEILNKTPGVLNTVATVSGKKPENRTALSCAAMASQIKCLDVLNAYGVDFAAKDEQGRTALHRAIETDSIEAVRWLIDTTPNSTIVKPEFTPVDLINLPDSDGSTPMHVAAGLGRNEIIDFLLASGAILDVSDNWQRTPLFSAVINHRISTVQLLLEKGAEVNHNDEDHCTPLMWTAKVNGQNLTKALLEKGAERLATDKLGNTAIHHAAGKGHLVVTEMLYLQREDLNAKNKLGETPLHLACRNNRERVVRALLRIGVDTDVWTTPPGLPEDKIVGGSETLRVEEAHPALLLACTPLHYACAFGHYAPATLLLDHGALVNANQENGKSPLMLAVESGHTGLVSFLVESGANVNTATAGAQMTALHIAVMKGFLDITKLLIAAGANTHAEMTERGHVYTPISFANRMNDPAILAQKERARVTVEHVVKTNFERARRQNPELSPNGPTSPTSSIRPSQATSESIPPRSPGLPNVPNNPENNTFDPYQYKGFFGPNFSTSTGQPIPERYRQT
jgi:ankyrin repeat protein